MNDRDEPVTCEVCKAPMVQELQDYVVVMDDEELLVEDVPIWVCEQCGYSFVEDEVIEAVEDMLEHMDTVASEEEE
jgi:YgiT-type zinc finger domain-containing protein